MVKKKGENGKKKGMVSGFYFFVSVLFIYIFLLFVSPAKFVEACMETFKILLTITPILVVVIVFMAFNNYFINPKMVAKYLGEESGIKGWLISIVGGIISTGPIYIWYPILQNLVEQGMKPKLVATFLYNRAVKIPLLPLMAYYFGIKFVVVLTILMVLMSIVEGLTVEILLKI